MNLSSSTAANFNIPRYEIPIGLRNLIFYIIVLQASATCADLNNIIIYIYMIDGRVHYLFIYIIHTICMYNVLMCLRCVMCSAHV